MSRKLVVLTEIIAPYRIPVFNELAKFSGIDLHVIFLAETDPTMRRWGIYRNEISFSYEILPHWRRRFLGYNVLLNRGLSAALSKARPDAIVSGGYSYLASWQALNWAKRNHVPLALWSESNRQDQRRNLPVVEYLKQRFMRACSAFIVPGKSAADYLASLGVDQKLIFTAPNAVDNDFFSSHSAAARQDSAKWRRELNLPERYFLYAGRLVPAKGVFDLLEAYRLLPSEVRAQIGLVFVGDGESEAELKSRSRAIAGGKVALAGFAQRELLSVYYGLAEALIFPTYTDPWGLVVNEAMACGLPVIVSSKAGCAVDLVQEGKNGYVIEPGDRSRLCTVMTQLAQDGKLISAMGTKSAEHIQQFSPRNCAAGFPGALGHLHLGAANAIMA